MAGCGTRDLCSLTSLTAVISLIYHSFTCDALREESQVRPIRRAPEKKNKTKL